ncbi:MAG: GNAT family N-acetyltransferase [Deltaproteobacteria bacterium]|nr:GNAT family N-acetyltransferase [Deltaproteobacteria bacterium]
MTSPPPREPTKLSEVPLVIETPRLVMRPLELGDADALFPFASDPELSKNMSWDPHRDRSETVGFLQRMAASYAANSGIGWAITHEGAVIGVISVEGIRWDFRAWRMDKAEIGYWLGRPHWGKGLMSEAAFAVLRWSFETLGLHKVTIGCVEGNDASRAIIEKLGFRFLAIFEEDFWRFGRWWDHRRYELTAGEYADSTRTMKFSRPRPA